MRSFSRQYVGYVFDRHRSSFMWVEFLYVVFFIISSPLAVINIIIYSGLFVILFIAQSFLLIQTPSKPPKDWFNPNGRTPLLKEKTIDTPDGFRLQYRISSDNIKDRQNKKTMLIACPLGQSGLSVYYPLLCQLTNTDNKKKDEWLFISWDYRGFWGSSSIQQNNESTADRIREVSIFECAKDANVILTAENIDCVDVCIGHRFVVNCVPLSSCNMLYLYSMGVQVMLEFAVLYPKKLRSMVLVNGSHGTVFDRAFQPIFRVPFMSDIVHEFLSFCLRNKNILEYIRWIFLSPIVRVVVDYQTWMVGNEQLKKEFGEEYAYLFMDQYLGNITKDEHAMYIYLRCFQELHAHSTLHLLDRVQTPTLIISGFWDLLCPALGSYEIAKKLKHNRHVCDLYSSHFTMLENPESCVYEIASFINYAYKSQFKINEKYIDLQKEM